MDAKVEEVLQNIEDTLKSNADKTLIDSTKRYFKEEIHCYGMKSADVKKIESDYWKEIKKWDKDEIFVLCEELYKSGYFEETAISASFSDKIHKKFSEEDLPMFKRWIEEYVTNWAACDNFCNHTMGSYMEMYPSHVTDLKIWAKSDNRWMRRASAVSLILPARRGMFLSDVFEIATILLTDSDDLVQKGYGWLLKEASKTHTQEVFEFVMANKRQMPRTALRYSIEKMPKDLKDEAMKKDW